MSPTKEACDAGNDDSRVQGFLICFPVSCCCCCCSCFTRLDTSQANGPGSCNVFFGPSTNVWSDFHPKDEITFAIFFGWNRITVCGWCNAFACSTSFSAKTITHFPPRQPTHRRVQHGCTKRQHQHRGQIKSLRGWKSKEFKVVATS